MKNYTIDNVNNEIILSSKTYEEFKKIIVRANKQFKSNELDKLINKINIAIKENKYVIHYGI